MDGKGRWMDNVFIERLAQSVKYAEIYLREHATLPELSTGLKEWFYRYNRWRAHQGSGIRMPEEVHGVDEAKFGNLTLRTGELLEEPYLSLIPGRQPRRARWQPPLLKEPAYRPPRSPRS